MLLIPVSLIHHSRSRSTVLTQMGLSLKEVKQELSQEDRGSESEVMGKGRNEGENPGGKKERQEIGRGN